MFKKELIVGVLATSFFLGLFGTSFAGEGNYESKIGTEAGNWEYNFDAPGTKADVAAREFQYDQESLVQVGTEAGNFDYRFDAPETKADVAARNYQYDQESLARVGTEAGDLEYRSDSTNNQAVAGKGDVKDAVCKGC